MDWIGNKKSVWTAIGASNHSKGEREENDFYATDPIAVDKLAAKYEIPHRVWEPACGTGCLSKRLVELGHEVYSSDLVDRGFGAAGVDFFEQMIPPVEGDYAILTNPPYKYVTEFVLHALELAPTVIMFLKTTTLESRGRYDRIFRNYPPHYVFQFVDRILCAKNAEFDECRKKLGAGAQAYAWFVWERGYKGKTMLDWI